MIYDTLNTAPVSPALEFVPVAAATSLQLSISAGGDPVPFKNSDSRWLFAPGDNVLLDRLTCTIPFGFGQGSALHVVVVKWYNQLGVPISIPELANSFLTIPDLCSGLEFGNGGLFIRAPLAAQGTGFYFGLDTTTLNLSMIGAPTILVSLAAPWIVTYWMGVRHTLPLVMGP